MDRDSGGDFRHCSLSQPAVGRSRRVCRSAQAKLCGIWNGNRLDGLPAWNCTAAYQNSQACKDVDAGVSYGRKTSRSRAKTGATTRALLLPPLTSCTSHSNPDRAVRKTFRRTGYVFPAALPRSSSHLPPSECVISIRTHKDATGYHRPRGSKDAHSLAHLPYPP